MFNWGILIVDAEGVARSSVPVHLNRAGTSYHDVPIIQAALEQGRTMVSDPLIGKRTKQPLVSIAAPIHDPTGKIQGVAHRRYQPGQTQFFSIQ